MLSTFHGMGVAVGPRVVVPPLYPVVASLAPAAGPVTGGEAVTVTGTGFAASMTVTLGATSVTPTGITTTSFNISTPAHAAGYALLTVKTSKGSNPLTANAGYVFTALASYVALTPFRILDTRARTCVQCGAGELAANQTRTLQITGVTGLKGGADQVPATATAIVMNVTAVSSTTGGLLTIYPTGTALPRASNLNFGAGTVTPNLVTVTLGERAQPPPTGTSTFTIRSARSMWSLMSRGIFFRLRAAIPLVSSTRSRPCASVTPGQGNLPTSVTKRQAPTIGWDRTRS